MKKYVDETLNLDQDTIDLLNNTAKENNATLDEVINEILIEYISERITFNEFKKLTKNDFNKFYIVTDKDVELFQIIPR